MVQQCFLSDGESTGFAAPGQRWSPSNLHKKAATTSEGQSSSLLSFSRFHIYLGPNLIDTSPCNDFPSGPGVKRTGKPNRVWGKERRAKGSAWVGWTCWHWWLLDPKPHPRSEGRISKSSQCLKNISNRQNALVSCQLKYVEVYKSLYFSRPLQSSSSTSSTQLSWEG